MIRKGLKTLSLLLLVGAPLLAIVAALAAFLLTPGPPLRSAAEFGAVLDTIWDRLLPSLLSGGVLWLLLSIDERLRDLTLRT